MASVQSNDEVVLARRPKSLRQPFENCAFHQWGCCRSPKIHPFVKSEVPRLWNMRLDGVKGVDGGGYEQVTFVSFS